MKKNSKIAASAQHNGEKRKTAPRKVKPEVEVLNAPQEPEEEEEEHTLEPLDLLDDDALPAAAVLNLDEEKDAELAEPASVADDETEDALPAPSVPAPFPPLPEAVTACICT